MLKRTLITVFVFGLLAATVGADDADALWMMRSRTGDVNTANIVNNDVSATSNTGDNSQDQDQDVDADADADADAEARRAEATARANASADRNDQVATMMTGNAAAHAGQYILGNVDLCDCEDDSLFGSRERNRANVRNNDVSSDANTGDNSQDQEQEIDADADADADADNNSRSRWHRWSRWSRLGGAGDATAVAGATADNNTQDAYMMTGHAAASADQWIVVNLRGGFAF